MVSLPHVGRNVDREEKRREEKNGSGDYAPVVDGTTRPRYELINANASAAIAAEMTTFPIVILQ
jgi:hypothetical protein